jgi:MFS family permease
VYALIFAGLLLPAGALGDRYGRRGVLLAGLAVFGAAAAAAIFVTSPSALIAARAVMGVGAALVMPTTLSVITTSFPPEERGSAVGVWVAGAGGGAVLGLFASGLLLQWFSWSSFFTLNVALAVLAFAGTVAVVPGSRAAEPVPLDPVGVLLSVTGIAGAVYATIEGPTRGWTNAVTLAAFAAAVIAIGAFLVWELRRDRPMLDPRLFLLRGFGMGSLSITVQFLAAFGFFFVIIQYLQYVAGYAPLRAAAALLPLPIILIPLARAAPRIADRVGLNRVDALGLALMATGFVSLSFLGTSFSYWHFAAGLSLFAAGMGLAGTPQPPRSPHRYLRRSRESPQRSTTPRANSAARSASPSSAASSTTGTAPTSPPPPATSPPRPRATSEHQSPSSSTPPTSAPPDANSLSARDRPTSTGSASPCSPQPASSPSPPSLSRFTRRQPNSNRTRLPEHVSPTKFRRELPWKTDAPIRHVRPVMAGTINRLGVLGLSTDRRGARDCHSDFSSSSHSVTMVGFGVDADELGASGAVVGDLVWHAGRCDHDVAGSVAMRSSPSWKVRLPSSTIQVSSSGCRWRRGPWRGRCCRGSARWWRRGQRL